MNKYAPLQDVLIRLPGPRLTLPFLAIERILRAPLPQSARAHAAWWANEDPAVTRHVHSRAWTLAGRQASPHLDRKEVLFTRTARRA